MPANLTPQYIEAEKAFREAGTVEEKIACLEEMLKLIPKHKGTEHIQGDLKRRLSKLREQSRQETARSRKSHSVKVHKEGAGQVAVVGPPNTGKSALVNALTNASPEIADYPFTTRFPQAAMMPYLDIKIQLVDLPPVSPEHEEHWVMDLVKAADAVLLVVDLSADPLGQLEFTLAHLEERKIVPPAAVAPEQEMPFGYAVRPMIVAANKADSPGMDEDLELLAELAPLSLPMLATSAVSGRGLDLLGQALFDFLAVIRVYSKSPGHKTDLDAPYVLPRGSTVLDFARKVHREIAENLKFARIWSAGKFDGQKINRDEVLADGDILELHS